MELKPELKEFLLNYFKSGCLLGFLYGLSMMFRGHHTDPWYIALASCAMVGLLIAPFFGLIAALTGLALRWDESRAAKRSQRAQKSPR